MLRLTDELFAGERGSVRKWMGEGTFLDGAEEIIVKRLNKTPSSKGNSRMPVFCPEWPTLSKWNLTLLKKRCIPKSSFALSQFATNSVLNPPWEEFAQLWDLLGLLTGKWVYYGNLNTRGCTSTPSPKVKAWNKPHWDQWGLLVFKQGLECCIFTERDTKNSLYK